MLYSMDRGVKVGLVLSLWKNPSKPRISSCSLPVNLVVCFRVVELRESATPGQWVCNAKSAAQVVRLDGLVCLLDCQGSETLEGNMGGEDGVAVQLSEASMDAARRALSLQGWQSVMTAPEPWSKLRRALLSFNYT